MTNPNRVTITGIATAVPEHREIAKGRPVARFSLHEGETYHTVVAWGEKAKQIVRTVKKGTRITILGSRVRRQYTGQDGQARHVTEIVVNDFAIQ